MVQRILVEKKEGHGKIAEALEKEIVGFLKIPISGVRLLARYDIEGLESKGVERLTDKVLINSSTESLVSEIVLEENESVFAVELLDGQDDQTEEFIELSAMLLLGANRPTVSFATVYIIKGASESELEKIKNYLINPVEKREASLELPKTLALNYPSPEPEKTIEGFKDLDDEKAADYFRKANLAMTLDDLIFIIAHYKKISRNPTITELKAIDTYWSDHCRHSTFFTFLESIKIKSNIPELKKAFSDYQALRIKHGSEKKGKLVSLMDIATMPPKEIKARGKLNDLEKSAEINACTINITADVGGEQRPYVVMFKNETHNHPTEIEPYGGAATALGGGIRDPLSGRVFVYHSMRVTGAADITKEFKDTLPTKLSQRYLTKTATEGFSSYANLAGLAGGIVQEYYHPGYAAKRMEAGFTVGAAPREVVKREEPALGDVVLYIGKETGRDGCGGATGSSKSHTAESIQGCSAEVQKGTPIVGRALQRLYRNPEFAKRVKRSNDFGAGGVSVAVGELSDSLDINLDNLPVKYPGLNSTEKAISESQERMAVVCTKEDAPVLIELARKENLNAVELATITDTGSLRIFCGGKEVFDVEREFLSTSGVTARAVAVLTDKKVKYFDTLDSAVATALKKGGLPQALKVTLSADNTASQKGMGSYFDSTAGGGSVFVPYGGIYQETPAINIAAKLPIIENATDTVTVCANGYNPTLSSLSPFTGAAYSVLASIIKVALAGVESSTIRLTFQEYFERLRQDPKKWGKPTAALLGALFTELALDIPSIGGKDSMSGTYEDIEVPPTLISFALGVSKASRLITNVFDAENKKVYLYRLPKSKSKLPELDKVKSFLNTLQTEIDAKTVDYATICEGGGVATAIAKSCFGNRVGFSFEMANFKNKQDLLKDNWCDILFSCSDIGKFSDFNISLVGTTTNSKKIEFGSSERIGLNEAASSYKQRYEEVFPSSAINLGEADNISNSAKSTTKATKKVVKPLVVIPILPDTNGEYDLERKFLAAGASVEKVVINFLDTKGLEASVKEFISAVKKAQIVALSSGYNSVTIGGISDCFITSLLSRSDVKTAMDEFTKRGLTLGINGGFASLLKLGYIETEASLTLNNLARHNASVTRVRVASNLSPWFSKCKVGDIFTVPLSNSEGRLVIDKIDPTQVPIQYADIEGNATMNYNFNPSGSTNAVAGLTSKCGKALGLNVNFERVGEDLLKNIEKNLVEAEIFEAAVEFFK